MSISRIYAIFVLICVHLQPTPTIAQPTLEQAAWKEARYKDFLALAAEREGKSSDASSGINVAMGLFMTEQVASALSKVIDLQVRPDITLAQKEKLNSLRADIFKYMRAREVYQMAQLVKTSGKVTMDSGSGTKRNPNCTYVKGNPICPRNGERKQSDSAPTPERSGSRSPGLGIKPDEARIFLDANSVGTLEASGYDVSPKVETKLDPDD